MYARGLKVLVGAIVLAIATVGCSQTDPGITTAVKSKLAADDTVKSYRIDVDTKDGVVTLSGEVDNAAAKARAVELARGTKGVRDVVDNTAIVAGLTPPGGIDDKAAATTGQAARKADEKTDEAQKKAGEKADDLGDATKDAALTAAVKSKFLANTDISGLKIDVDTRMGVVTLNGTVPTAAEKKKAVAVAKETDGVKKVVDNLKVGKS
jgi:hyperosmotically inducible protein